MNIYTAAITLILVMDPLGNVPIYISVLKSVEPSRRGIIILRESFIAFLIMAIFLFFGQYILEGLGISQPALDIAGGIILFLIALQMIFSEFKMQEHQVGEPFIVPLAIPLVAGPSALATVLLLVTQQPEKIWHWFLALVIASTTVTVILLSSLPLRRMLGTKGLMAVERLMGMILTTVAVQMFLTGIKLYFK